MSAPREYEFIHTFTSAFPFPPDFFSEDQRQRAFQVCRWTKTPYDDEPKPMDISLYLHIVVSKTVIVAGEEWAVVPRGSLSELDRGEVRGRDPFQELAEPRRRIRLWRNEVETSRGRKKWGENRMQLAGPDGFFPESVQTVLGPEPPSRNKPHVELRRKVYDRVRHYGRKNRKNPGWSYQRYRQYVIDLGASIDQISDVFFWLVKFGGLEHKEPNKDSKDQSEREMHGYRAVPGFSVEEASAAVTLKHYRQRQASIAPRRPGGRPRAVSEAQEQQDQQAAATLKPREWCEVRDRIGIPLTPTFEKFGSWVNAYDSEDHDIRTRLNIIKSQKTKLYRDSHLTKTSNP